MKADPGSWTTVARAFAEVVAATPDAPALLLPKNHDVGTVSYGELARKAGGIAAMTADLTATSTGPSTIGLLLDHGADMVAAMLGTLSAGSVYVPLDPSHPGPRLLGLTRRANLEVILATDPSIVPNELRRCCHVVAIDQASDTDLIPSAGSPEDPAYVLFTSGSTGQPKGVLHTQTSVLHGIGNHVTNLGITSSDRTSLLTSFGFDMSVSDLYSALLTGAAACLYDVRNRGVTHLADALDNTGVTIYHSTPTVFRLLAASLGDRRLDRVRVVVLGGEPVTRQDLIRATRHVKQNGVFINGYGATEASFVAQNHIPLTSVDTTASGHDTLPIGHPLNGYTLELHGADGDVGEILVRSQFLARGYLNAPDETEDRFSVDGQLYRTGDIARILEDGKLDLLGRVDDQIKVRGQRVEPAEAEAVLEQRPEIQYAIVCASMNNDELLGLVEVIPGCAEPDPAELRSWLGERLPTYAVPDRIHVLAQLPLTSTGKLDRRAARAMALRPAAGRDERSTRPDTESEAIIRRAWSQVLGVSPVPRDSHFFDVGGTSLRLFQLQAVLREEFGIDCELAELLAKPTVEMQAASVSPIRSVRGSVTTRLEYARERRQARAAKADR